MDVLKIKHWQWVLLAFASFFLVGVAEQFALLSWSFNSVKAFSMMIQGVLLISYPMVTWKRLNELLADEDLFERTTGKTVLIPVLIVTLHPITFLILPYTTVRLAMSIVAISALIFICSLPAKQLKSIELKRNAGVWEYAPDTFNFLFWPLGVFWIQPRINNIPERRIGITE